MRLKGGDPFVFGRGGEEALALREAGIPFEVVPGITAGVAAPAYAGIPVTHRELATRRRVRHRPRGPGQAGDGARLAGAGRVPRARSSSTWACARCRGSPSGSSRAGARPDEPVAVVERGTLPGQRTLLATLATSPSAPRRRAIRAPAITLVGAGRRAARAARLAGARGRCTGARVAVTRARAQASALAARLRELGADGRRGAGDPHRSRSTRALPDLAGYDLSCVTSPERRARAVRAARRRRPRRARARRATRRRDRPGHRAGAARARHRRRRRAGARGRRGAGGGARATSPCARALIARGARGPRRAAGRAARARRRGRRAGALRDRRRAARRGTRARGRRRRLLTFTSASTVRFFPPAGGALRRPAARLDRSGHQRGAARGRARAGRRGRPHTPDGLIAALLAASRERPRPPARCTCARRRRRTTARASSRRRRAARDARDRGRADAQAAGARDGRGPPRPAARCCCSLVLRSYDPLLPLRARPRRRGPRGDAARGQMAERRAPRGPQARGYPGRGAPAGGLGGARDRRQRRASTPPSCRRTLTPRPRRSAARPLRSRRPLTSCSVALQQRPAEPRRGLPGRRCGHATRCSAGRFAGPAGGHRRRDRRRRPPYSSACPDGRMHTLAAGEVHLGGALTGRTSGAPPIARILTDVRPTSR